MKGKITLLVFDEFSKLEERFMHHFSDKQLGYMERFQLVEHPIQDREVKPKGRHHKRPAQKNRGPIKRGEWN